MLSDAKYEKRLMRRAENVKCLGVIGSAEQIVVAGIFFVAYLPVFGRCVDPEKITSSRSTDCIAAPLRRGLESTAAISTRRD
jgi:hypothetical protein